MDKTGLFCPALKGNTGTSHSAIKFYLCLSPPQIVHRPQRYSGEEHWLCIIFYLNPRRRSDTAASPALTCVGSPGSPPEVAASDASDLIPGYKPPFLERTLVCIEPQNLEDDDHDDVYYTISARDSNVDDDVR